MTWTQDDVTQYAEIPAGTIFEWAEWKESIADDDYKQLKNLKSVGALGNNRNYVDCTTLIDTVERSIDGIKQLVDVTWNFVDAPDEQNFESLLTAAEADKRVAVRITFPGKNKRICTGDFYLSGFSMDEPDSTAVIAISVNARQAKLDWNRSTTRANK